MRRPALTRVVPAAVLAALAAVACSARAVVVRLPGDAVPVARGEWITDYSRALASIAAVIERELDVPPLEVTLHLHPHRGSLRSALLESGYEPSFARETADTMHAIGGHRQVLLNAGAIYHFSWPDRIGLLAHELTHSVQYELGGGHRGTSDQWLREGFAEWMAVRVLESLGVSTMTLIRDANLRALRRTKNRAHLPPLTELATFRQWVHAVRASGDAEGMYAQAFLAVDFLISEHGVDAATDYFRRFARSQNRVENFVRAFDRTPADFDAAFRRELAARLGTSE